MTAHAVASLSARFGTEVPPVLWTPPDPRRTVAHGPAARDEPELDADEASALDVLAAPQVRIEARATGELDTRLCLARSGHLTARVVRAAGTATVDLPHCDGSADRLAALVAPVLGSAPPADPAVAASFPAEAGRASLRAGDAGEIGAALRAIGVDADAARLIGRVFARSQRSVECTLYAGGNRCATVVAVIDSPAGRVVVRTANEPGAGEWISVAEGSPHRIGRALRRACEELPGGGWTPGPGTARANRARADGAGTSGGRSCDMAGTKAELAAMKTGADTLDDLGAQMKTTLSQLRSDVEATQGVWAGAAQVAFLGVMARWDESAAKVNTALVDISTMLSGNTTSYRSQEDQNTSDITALSL